MNPTLSALFPNASKSCRDANPDVLPQPAKQNDSGAILSAPRRRGVMNKTEREFSLYLDAIQRKGEILRWVFEGMTLRWEGVKYTPDFVVFEGKSDLAFEVVGEKVKIKLIEIKGGYLKGKYERAIERFRHARSMWPEFSFEMHQKQKGAWKRIH